MDISINERKAGLIGGDEVEKLLTVPDRARIGRFQWKEGGEYGVWSGGVAANMDEDGKIGSVVLVVAKEKAARIPDVEKGGITTAKK